MDSHYTGLSGSGLSGSVYSSSTSHMYAWSHGRVLGKQLTPLSPVIAKLKLLIPGYRTRYKHWHSYRCWNVFPRIKKAKYLLMKLNSSTGIEACLALASIYTPLPRELLWSWQLQKSASFWDKCKWIVFRKLKNWTFTVQWSFWDQYRSDIHELRAWSYECTSCTCEPRFGPKWKCSFGRSTRSEALTR